MGARLALERFDAPDPWDDHEPGNGDAAHAAPASPDPGANPAADPGEAPVDPPEPGGDAQGRHEAMIETLAAQLGDLDERVAQLCAKARREAVCRVVAALEAALPELAGAKFAHVAADALAEIVERAPGAEVALHLSETDHDAVLEALSGRDGQPQRLAPRLDPALAPGELRLAWPDGGAALSAAALSQSWRTRLRRALDPDLTDPDEETAT